jgi:putative membrane protein|tara:strand:+ start:371 stop:820 length:450 start_codon:yes stop_codon:yes gene_type:complete
MIEFINTYYAWFKALHVIAIISWMAGMLYLPRLFVYHCAAEKGSQSSETFKTMERRLLKFIMTPAMIVAWIAALLMIASNSEYLMQSGWFHAKFLLVFIMSGIHGVFSKWVKVFAADANTKSAKFYKIWNEVPTALMVIIVVLVIAKPF